MYLVVDIEKIKRERKLPSHLKSFILDQKTDSSGDLKSTTPTKMSKEQDVELNLEESVQLESAQMLQPLQPLTCTPNTQIVSETASLQSTKNSEKGARLKVRKSDNNDDLRRSVDQLKKENEALELSMLYFELAKRTLI